MPSGQSKPKRSASLAESSRAVSRPSVWVRSRAHAACVSESSLSVATPSRSAVACAFAAGAAASRTRAAKPGRPRRDRMRVADTSPPERRAWRPPPRTAPGEARRARDPLPRAHRARAPDSLCAIRLRSEGGDLPRAELEARAPIRRELEAPRAGSAPQVHARELSAPPVPAQADAASLRGGVQQPELRPSARARFESAHEDGRIVELEQARP